MDVMQETVRVDDFAEQEGPPVAQARRVPPELMPGIRLRNGFRPGRNQVAGQEPQAFTPRRNAGSRPSSVANGSLRTSNRASSKSFACHATANSGSSRANRLPRVRVVAAATLTPPT